MKFSKIEIDILNKIIKKTEEENKKKRRAEFQRRKSQIRGKTINKRIQKRQKSVRQGRKVTKKHSSIP